MNRITMKLFISAIAAVAVGGLAVLGGCGDDGFEQIDQGQLSLESQGTVQLQINQDDRPEEQSDIQFSNSGTGDLTFSRIELVDAPARLTGIQSAGDQPQQCEYDRNNPPQYGTGCETGQVCWYLTNTCRPTGFPDTPVSIAPERSLNLQLVVLPGDGPIECPDAPEDDDNAPANYCGKLIVETDAANDGENIVDGNATVYFTYQAGSGQIRVEPPQISFDDASPGGTFTRDFTISNPDSEETLFINGASINKESSMFEVTGDEPISGAEISPQATKSWTLNFTPPESANLAELTGIYLTIESSAKNNSSASTFISIGGSGATPVVTVEPELVSFDSASEQTVTVTNVAGDSGEDRPNIRLRSLTTAENDAFYTFIIDGTEIGNNIDTDLLQPGDSKEITVKYAKPDGESGAGATEARLSYTYFESSEQISSTKRFTLLGDQASAPLGKLSPTSLLFRAADGNEKTHAFVIRNIGNAALDLSGAALGDPAVGSKDEFTFDVPSSVPAGSIAEGTVTFTGANAETDNVSLNMNSNTAGPVMTLNLFADGSSPDANIDALITPFGDDTVAVDSKVELDAQQSTVPDSSSLDSAEWYLLSRPSGSSAFLNKNGRSVAFFPDAAGEYKVGLILYSGSTGSSTTYTFTAE
ncbi:MAG: hypothetical protein ACQEVA_01815 [Myxococcota bacterium]